MPKHGAVAVKRGAPGKPLVRAALASIVGVISGRETTANVKARFKGYRGESLVANALRGLPGAWRFFLMSHSVLRAWNL
ncbi:MAG: hypothetical protein OEM81_07645 [Acidimicrobiia bacterium]|nr:hypothetical protein [Acidimicrobiia bacterium]